MAKQTKRGRKPAPARDPRWVELGKKLIALRHAKGWKAYEVAAMIGVDPATISQIENGKRATGPERETLEHLAKLFQVSLSTLTGTETPPHYGTKELSSSGDHSASPVVQLADIRAAVSDAIFAIVADIFESVSESRARRTETDAHGKAGSPETGSAQRYGRG